MRTMTQVEARKCTAAQQKHLLSVVAQICNEDRDEFTSAKAAANLKKMYATATKLREQLEKLEHAIDVAEDKIDAENRIVEQALTKEADKVRTMIHFEPAEVALAAVNALQETRDAYKFTALRC